MNIKSKIWFLASTKSTVVQITIIILPIVISEPLISRAFKTFLPEVSADFQNFKKLVFVRSCSWGNFAIFSLQILYFNFQGIFLLRLIGSIITWQLNEKVYDETFSRVFSNHIFYLLFFFRVPLLFNSFDFWTFLLSYFHFHFQRSDFFR